MKLEICFATMSSDMKHLISMVEELKVLAIERTKREAAHVGFEAQQEERWANHMKGHEQIATIDDLARVADRVASYKAAANGTAESLEGTKEKLTETRISIAKIIAAGAGGGVVVSGLIELVKFLVT